MAEPAHFVGRFVLSWEGNDTGCAYFHVRTDAAMAAAQNPRALPMDSKSGQVLVRGAGPAAALAQEVLFTNAMAGKIFASFSDMPSLQAAVLGASPNLMKLRDLQGAFKGRDTDKTVIMAGNDYKIVSVDAVNNRVTLRPLMTSVPLSGVSGLDRTIELLGMPALRVVAVDGREPVAPVVATALTPTSALPQKIEVELTKNTFLSKAGDSSWTYNIYRGVTPDPSDKVALKTIARAGMKALPRDTSYENYMVVLDLNFVHLAFARMGSVDSVVRAHNEAMKTLVAKLLADERVAPETSAKDKKDEDKKAPHPVVHDILRGISTCVRTICHLLERDPESKDTQRIVEDQVELGHDILGRLLRRIKYALDHPSAENCRTPIWYYRQNTKKRDRDEMDS